MNPRKWRETWAILTMLAGVASLFYPIVIMAKDDATWNVCAVIGLVLVVYGRHILFENEE